MKEKTVKISIVIPAYNTGLLLSDAIRSVFDAGLIDFEVIIIDDGSIDGTADIADDLCRSYCDVVCIHQNNHGVSGARNAGINIARGEYIMFFDADDSVDPGALAPCNQILKDNNPDVLMFGMSFDYYYHGKLYRREYLRSETDGCYNRNDWMTLRQSLFKCNYLSPAWNKFFRRDIILKYDIRFSEKMHVMEDFDFTVRYMEHTEMIYIYPEVIYRYRLSEDEKKSAKRLKSIQSLVDYMSLFPELSKEWQPIMTSVYFMLLRQKVSCSGIRELAAIAEDNSRSPYLPKNKPDKSLYRELKEKRYLKIYLRNVLSHIRHKIAVIVKYYKSNKSYS